MSNIRGVLRCNVSDVVRRAGDGRRGLSEAAVPHQLRRRGAGARAVGLRAQGAATQARVYDLWQYLVAEAREHHGDKPGKQGQAKKVKGGGSAPEGAGPKPEDATPKTAKKIDTNPKQQQSTHQPRDKGQGE